MSRQLFVFGDEYGTMPVNDDDGPFLAATVAVRAPFTAKPQMPGRLEDAADALRELGAFVCITYVLPSDGYAKTRSRSGRSQGATMRTSRVD